MKCQCAPGLKGEDCSLPHVLGPAIPGFEDITVVIQQYVPPAAGSRNSAWIWGAVILGIMVMM